MQNVEIKIKKTLKLVQMLKSYKRLIMKIQTESAELVRMIFKFVEDKIFRFSEDPLLHSLPTPGKI